ncbi:MAG: alanine--tRNA ligase [Candidatus Hadarchaeota archaeon]|nr:alanine--tRNA ligase [Candidatus Hadarchaeota archaeon]
MSNIYQVGIFEREGFQRKRCPTCGRTFWTLDPERRTCGDTPCDEYTFIGKPPIKRKYTPAGAEKTFLKFFEEHDHAVMNRYPVVARWRDDIFLTIASIADFQPWVTSGMVPPPANPLVVSQPSIRLNDIDNVGRSGRHFTLFFMGGHHAFNSRRKRVYWTDETVALCHEFLTGKLGIDPTEITYVQDFWEGGGNAGEDFEVNVRGLELATLVFMHYQLENGKRRELPLKIVDTGYGIERLVWASQGTPSSYEAVFGPVVERLRKFSGIKMPSEDVLREHSKLAGLMDIETGRDLAALRSRVSEQTGLDVGELDKIMAPLEAVYAIADHLRCLAFMFGDGITPSNMGGGYLSRLVLRRTLRLMRELGLREPLAKLMELELSQLIPVFPEFRGRKSYILEVIDLEERRYGDTLARGTRLVDRLASSLKRKGRSALPMGELIRFYDSHGLPPEIVKEAAQKRRVKVEVPEDFYIQVAKSHSQAELQPETTAKIPRSKVRGLPKTRALYYENPCLKEFDARVLRRFGDQVVLDRTAFYPEGGGQPADTGSLQVGKKSFEVADVQKVDGVISHRVVSRGLRAGQKVKGKIDWKKRSSLMRHHTATHILLGAARRVLGDHVWQHGVQKGPKRTRFDISHFKRISDEELREVERLANRVVMENRQVSTKWMDRSAAERRYGHDLYQGGVVPGKKIRVVDIEGWNAQACAGTHCLWTGDVGLIKIVRTERIQDGVERLEFASGGAAFEFIQERERKLLKAAKVLRTTPGRIAAATQRLFRRWKSAQKELSKLRGHLAELRLSELHKKAKKVGAVRVVSEIIEDASVDELIKVAEALVREDRAMVAILGTCDETARLVVVAGEEALRVGIDCRKIASEAAKVLDGGGGGRVQMGQGGGPQVERLKEAIAAGVKTCGGQQR